MATGNAQFILQRQDSVPLRTARGNEILRRDAREIPRRLRGLLLAIDGRQQISTYLQTLSRFGDVPALLEELMVLGLIELRHRGRTQVSDAGANGGDPSSGFDSDSAFTGTWDHLLDDPERLYHSFTDPTVAGTFDDLVRVAQADHKDYKPPAQEPPGHGEQIERLFILLEAVRKDRQRLRERTQRLLKYRDRYKYLMKDNDRLRTTAQWLSVLLGVTVVGLVVVVLFVARR